MSVAEDSPSAERRKALKEADASNKLRVLGSCPLTKYIDIADRLMEHFQDAVDGRRLDEAYVFGLRYANLCISSLPQHPEWKLDTSSRARKRLTSQVGDVLSMMDVIKQRMDAEELMKVKAELLAKQQEENRKKEEEDRRKLQQDEELQREQSIRSALEEERAQFLAEQRAIREEEIKRKQKAKKERKEKEKAAKAKEEAAKKVDIEKSAMAKLQAMQAQMSSAVEQAPPKAEVVETKKKTKSPKVVKVKAIGFSKKNSNRKLKEEKELLPAQTDEQYDVVDVINDTPALPQKSTPTIQVSVSANLSTSIEDDSINRKSERKLSKGETTSTEDDSINRKSERKSSKGEKKKKKRTAAASTESKEAKIEPEAIEKKEKAKPISEKPNTVKLEMVDSDSTRSITSKKSKLKSKIKSTIEAAKSSIPTMPSPMLRLSTRKSVSDTIENPSTKVSINSSTKIKPDAAIASQLHTPRSQKEKASIEKLKRVISIQEDRLEDIEGKQIPDLLESAKSYLQEDKKKEALKCLSHKKRLERMVDTIKAAVFNMETQMFMLESAIEDRHVKKALDEAASAMAGLQQNIADPTKTVMDMKDMSASLPALDIGDATDEELMEELEQWLKPEEHIESEIDDDIALLSMPTFLPAAPEATPVTSPSVDRIPTKL